LTYLYLVYRSLWSKNPAKENHIDRFFRFSSIFNKIKRLQIMKKILFTFIFSVTSLLVFSQKGIPNSSKDVLNFAGAKVSRNSGIMYGYEPDTEIEGSSYADSTWKKGSFIFFPEKKDAPNDTVNGFTLRYDVFKGEVDILHKKNVFAATSDMLDGFFYQDKIIAKNHYFLNARNYNSTKDEQIKGFVEVLSNGKLKLVKRYYITTKKPDYNPSLNVGNRNYVIQHRTQLYVIKGKNLLPLDNPKASSLVNGVMSAHASKITEYAKSEKINTKNENDLTRLFDYFNTL
jgi:hypothetical protein